MRHTIAQCTRFIAVGIVGCAGVVGCNTEEAEEKAASTSPPEVVAANEETVPAVVPNAGAGERNEAERGGERIRCRESTGQGELSIRWEKAPEESRTQINAVIHNNGRMVLSAEPVLLAANPSLGEARERRLGVITVAPGSDVVVPVNVADLPMQSVGEATSVSVGLRWRRSDTQQEMTSPQALSAALYVTHDDESFRTAVVRDVERETARHLALPTSRRLRSLRALDSAGVMKLRPRLELEAGSEGMVTLDPSVDAAGRAP